MLGPRSRPRWPASLGRGEIVGVAPVVNPIPARVPAEADQHDGGWVPFPGAPAADGTWFALQVAGNSMTFAGHPRRRTAIVRRQRAARSGNIVAATVEGGTTLKRYLLEGRSESNDAWFT